MSVTIRLDDGAEVDIRAAVIAAMGDDRDENERISNAVTALLAGARRAARDAAREVTE